MNYNVQPSMTNNTDSIIIPIKTNIDTDNNKYWIKISKNNQFVNNLKDSNESIDTHENLYYWCIIDHNFNFKPKKNLIIYFIEPDLDKIQVPDDSSLYWAIDSNGSYRLIHNQMYYQKMKMNTHFFITKNHQKIIDALGHVKLCIVCIVNNQQILIDINNKNEFLD